MAMDLPHLRAQISDLDLGWTPGVTSHARHSLLQARSRLGAVPPPGTPSLLERQQRAAAAAPADMAGLPAAVDWRNNGGNYVTDIRSQESCGSCVAFGAAAVLESMTRIQAHNPNLDVNLSEAHLFFCYGPSHGAGACPDGGWWPDQAFAVMKDGLVDETCFPYTPANQDCSLCPDWGSRLTSYTSFIKVSSITAMKQHIANVGPMSACFTVYEDFYYHYTGGVYTYHPTTSGNVIGGHCIAIVGYDDAQQCWIAKNSWGALWGESGYFRIHYGSAGIDASMWGIDGVVRSPLIPETQAARATVPMSVLARYPSHLDVFAVAPDGRTMSTWWDQSVGWGRWFSVGGGVAHGGGSGSPMTSVARYPDHLDVFVVGTDGQVYSIWWDASSGWAGWFVLPGITCRPGTAVNVVSRNPDHLDLFAVADDGRIMSTWWDANGGWARWFHVGGGYAAPGSSCTAIARHPHHLDLFVVGTDNRVWSTWWDGATGWAGWFALLGVTCRADSTVDVVARHPEHLDLFTVANDGRIVSTWWDGNGGWANGWFHISGGYATPGGQVSVVSRYPDHLDLFVIGTDNRVYSTWWDINGGWAGWFVVSGGVSLPGGQVAAISRFPEHLDVFVVGTDGLVWSTWWDGSTGWAGWFQVT